MSPIGADNEVRAHFQFVIGSFCAHADHTLLLEDQIENLVFHEQLEVRKSLCVRGEEIEKIPLGHKRNELAARGQLREIRDPHGLTVDHCTQLPHFLVRLRQKFIEQSKLVHQL